MAEQKPFTYKDSSGVEHSVVLEQDLFTLSQADKKLHDVSFKGKPTTFMKDALIRFCKNKSSIVASIILGAMILLALLLPLFISYDVSNPNVAEAYLQPKLFEAGSGFWDGTKEFKDVIYDESTKAPVAATLKSSAILSDSMKIYEGTTDTASKYASGGYLRVATDEAEASLLSKSFTAAIKDASTVSLAFNVEVGQEPEDFENASYSVYLDAISGDTTTPLTIVSDSKNYGKQTFTKADIQGLADVDEENTTYDLRISVPTVTGTSHAIYVSDISLTVDGNEVSEVSMSDANTAMLNKTYQTVGSKVGLYGAKILYCSFLYDTYDAVYGDVEMTVGKSVLDDYIAKGYMTYDFNVGIESFTILNDICPVRSVSAQKNTSGMGIVVQEVTAIVSQYRYMGYSSMPMHLFGTDNNGRDMVKYVAEGTRNSLGLGVIISLITFVFGLIYGSIEGYFGGAADLIMERVVDILGYIPWIVVVTLCVLHLGQNFGVFILAMCLTDWISTSSLTRTQFYRFKRREYVLASRSLGASDFRLIFKHILPNSMGTIITSSVLMVPSVIFAEASISYLGIGLKNMSSLGVILSNNQSYINSYSYLLVFPSIVLALMMICFNLFGNGLRDAFNPSLKGSD